MWQSYEIGGVDTISVPALVEKNAEDLRTKYLAWIYELGLTELRGRPLIEQLKLDPELSYWWLTLLAGKCSSSKSKHIKDAIKLIALSDWLESNPVRRIALKTTNKSLALCIQILCNSFNIAYEVELVPQRKTSLFFLEKIKNLYRALPQPIQAVIWLARYVIDRWAFRGVGVEGWRTTKAKTTFFSYFYSFSAADVKDQFKPNRYWTRLPEILRSAECKTNWLHLYIKDGSFKNSKQAAEMLGRLNKVEKDNQNHTVLDSFISYKVIINTVRVWLKLVFKDIYLREKLNTANKTSAYLWPLFADDWRQSMSGITAISNCLTLSLMEAALGKLPQQKHGIYLQENQAWEQALIHYWRAKGHGGLVGFPHSTVRFWDLRYFFDPRSYEPQIKYGLPRPSLVAVSGPAVFAKYKQGGYPMKETVEVEALRYLDLTDQPAVSNIALNSLNSNRTGGFFRMLVVTDYSIESTKLQLDWLTQSIIFLPMASIVIKPHPACSINLSDYPSLDMTLSANSIADLLVQCDVVYSSAATSAAVDAYCAGVPVVSLLDATALNLSPLRGGTGVSFVTTTEELANALLNAARAPRKSWSAFDFFTLDRQLPRWQALLLTDA